MKLDKLEALRGFAAFYVVLHHTISPKYLTLFGTNFGFLLRFGQEAVILFFLLSGFVIHYSYQMGKDKTFSTYFQKRALRIYIPLLAVFIAGYLLESHKAGGLIDPNFFNLLQNIFMLQDWELVKPNVLAAPYMGNTPLWSLTYEWWFYMLYFPIVNFIKESSSRHYFVYGIAILSAIAYNFYPIFVFRTLTYLGIWWTGVYLSGLYIRNGLRQPMQMALPISAMITTSLILFSEIIIQKNQGQNLLLGFHPVLEFRHYVFATIIVILALIWRRFSWLGFDIIFKPFLIFSPISYVIYISHFHLMAKAEYLNFIKNPIAQWLSYFAILIVFSWIVERVIYIKVRNFFFRRRQPPVRAREKQTHH